MLIERKEFDHQVRTLDGNPYADPETVYHDLDRLVVCFLATTTREEIKAIYQRAGFLGDPYSAGLHEAAKRDLATRMAR